MPPRNALQESKINFLYDCRKFLGANALQRRMVHGDYCLVPLTVVA